MMNKIKASAEYIKSKISFTPEIAIILGSGLGPLSKLVTDGIVLNYSDIPNFHPSGVCGHSGELIAGTINGRKVLVMNGRWHHYEGYDMKDVTLPIRVFAFLGIRKLIVTNAAGGIKDSLRPGSIMLIDDHLSLMCPSPLIGDNLDEFGPRFPDMSHLYSEEFLKLARNVADGLGINVNQGVYCYLSGPQYETPAEIRALRVLGCDAVGMSTVPEVIVAGHCGMEVLGISLITNKAAGLGFSDLSHEDVQKTASLAEKNMVSLVSAIISKI